MNQKLVDLSKAIGITAASFFGGTLIANGLIWLAKSLNFSPMYIAAALLFSFLVYVNYLIVKK